MYKRNCLIVLLLVTVFSLGSFGYSPGADGKLRLVFEHYAGDRPLLLDNEKYINEAGQSYVITGFKYYISNIKLVKSDGNIVDIGGYYLVNEEESSSMVMRLEHLPAGPYTGIRFVIGVDSIHNCSGAQEGALDPVNAMFWTWNSGYIFMKLEGKSPASASPGHVFEFHIGGYKTPANCIREVSLQLPSPLIISGIGEVHIKTDVAEIFKSPTTIDFSKLSSVTDFHNAVLLANNYMDMFSVLGVK